MYISTRRVFVQGMSTQDYHLSHLCVTNLGDLQSCTLYIKAVHLELQPVAVQAVQQMLQLYILHS